MIVYLFGAIVAYTLTANVLITNLINEPLKTYFDQSNNYYFDDIIAICAYIFAALISLPGELLKKTAKLKWVTLASIVILCYMMSVIIIQSPQYMINFPNEHKRLFNFDYPMQMFQTLGLFTYSFNCIVTFHLAKSSLKEPTERRLKKMTNRAIYILYVPYILVAILGVCSIGDMALKIDLFPNRPSLPNDLDILMKIAKASFCIVI